jgi:hypothetical protein
MEGIVRRCGPVTARRIVALVCVLATTVTVVTASSAEAATPLASLSVIVNQPPVNGLLSLCITSHSLDPGGTCIDVPPGQLPPDVTGLPTLPLVSGGDASADVSPRFFGGIVFGFVGQITLGTQVFHGQASGTAPVSAFAASMAIPSFTLTGTSTTDTLTAPCSGQWRGTTDPNTAVDAALSVLTCNGSVNGGMRGQATVLSVYRLTGQNTGEHFYNGVFAGS